MIKGCLTHQGRKTQQQRANMGEGFSTSLKRRTSRHKYIGNHWHKYVGNHCHKYVGNHCHKYVSYHCHKYVSNHRPDLMGSVAVTNKCVYQATSTSGYENRLSVKYSRWQFLQLGHFEQCRTKCKAAAAVCSSPLAAVLWQLVQLLFVLGLL